VKYALTLTINSEVYEVMVEAHRSLLDVVREEVGLTGAKCGCEDGRCGACSIIVNGKLLKSCLTLALQHQGAAITTIEGVGIGEELHPLQQAFLEHGAVQCGFCTPAMVLAAKSLLEENPSPDETAIRQGLQGVLCRCGTYTHVTRALADLAGA